MRSPPDETAALRQQHGGSKSVSIFSGNPIYQDNGVTRNPEYPVAKVASRFHLTIATARLYCRLSGIGGGAV